MKLKKSIKEKLVNYLNNEIYEMYKTLEEDRVLLNDNMVLKIKGSIQMCEKVLDKIKELEKINPEEG